MATEEGLVKRRTYQDKVEEGRKELEELERERKGAEAEDDQDETEGQSTENLSPEEKTFKKRYGDLRSHTEKLKREHQRELEQRDARITELEARLESGDTEVEAPGNEQELGEWMKENPQVARIFSAMVEQQVSSRLKETESRFDDLESAKAETTAMKTEGKIRKAHPDYDDVMGSDEFHDWLATRSASMQAAFYDRVDQPDECIDAIDLYKSKHPIKGKTNKKPEGAADSVSGRGSRPPRDDNKPTFSESQIERMSAKEFAKNAAAIDLARAEGRIEYDLSAAS